MARSRSSSRWLQEHVTDPFVRQAQKEGFRSRSAYKLIQLDEKDRLLRPGMRVVDLGSAPGGWSQVAALIVGAKGRVLATDILPMDALRNVQFVQGDFTDEAVFQRLLELLGGELADLVMSDMAPNISGVDDADQAASMYLVELALDFAQRVLRPGGDFLAKVFQGAGSEAFLKEVRRHFTKVAVRKPAASRSRSREVYMVARGLRRG
ncbi:MAG: 23S rRNA (uridine(2552)-2'-O)-methyltransferase RlmE [Steroidobacteraceae bacterium]